MSARPPFSLPHGDLVLALFLSACAIACGARVDVEPTGGVDGGPCGRGKARSCECEDGQRGIAHCVVGGGDWSECFCGSSFEADEERDSGLRDSTWPVKPVPGQDNPLGGPKSGASCSQPFDVRAHSASSKDEPYLVQRPLPQLGGGDAPPVCFYFKPPYPLDSRAVSLQPLLDETTRPHRWLLYGVDDAKHADGEVAPCDGTEPGAYALAGFYPGSDDLVLPGDVSLALPSGKTAGLVLQVHYDAPGQVALLDRTGVRICTGEASTRPNIAAVHVLGTEAICVPPARQDYEVTGTCKPHTDRGAIHVLSVYPHMHKLGRRMQVSIKRADGRTELLEDQTFPYLRTTPYPKSDVVLDPGDTLETRCWYDNTGLFSVPFGEKSSDENCFAFVTAWPAGALTINPEALDPLRAFSLTERASRRCLDPFGILASCNGLADSPY